MYECCCQCTLNTTNFFQVATHLSLTVFQYKKNLFVAFGFSVELFTLSEGRWGWKLWLSNNLYNFKDENWGDTFSWHSWYEEAKTIGDASFAYYLSTKWYFHVFYFHSVSPLNLHDIVWCILFLACPLSESWIENANMIMHNKILTA